jgi:flavin reductase
LSYPSGIDLQDAFRVAMRRFAATVSIISCQHAGQPFGMSATAVTSVCIDPPAVLACINRSNATNRMLAEGVQFCVNVLRSYHSELSRHFGGSGRGFERFRYGNWAFSPEGPPTLVDAQANLLCSVDCRLEYGTHSILVGRVLRIECAQEVDVLVYQNGLYQTISPAPS